MPFQNPYGADPSLLFDPFMYMLGQLARNNPEANFQALLPGKTNPRTRLFGSIKELDGPYQLDDSMTPWGEEIGPEFGPSEIRKMNPWAFEHQVNFSPKILPFLRLLGYV